MMTGPTIDEKSSAVLHEDYPALSLTQLAYIRTLPDSHKNYTRFFDALLITRPSHRAFFNDLRAFRSQIEVVSLLSTCELREDASQPSREALRQRYREVTRSYLVSRFAHPWCRKVLTVSNPSVQKESSTSTAALAGRGLKTAKGWWAADWATTGRPMSKKHAEEEEKVHQMLVPIWIIMRAKMFPGDDAVNQWWRVKQDDEDRIRRVQEFEKKSAKEELGLETSMSGHHLERVRLLPENDDVSVPASTKIHAGDSRIPSNPRSSARDSSISPTILTPTILLTEADGHISEEVQIVLPTTLSSSPSPSPSPSSSSSTSSAVATDQVKEQLLSTNKSQQKPPSTASSIPITLHAVKSQPNLRDSFWQSEEAHQLQRDLGERERKRERDRQRRNSGNTTGSSNSSKTLDRVNRKLSFHHQLPQQQRHQVKSKYYVPGYDSTDDEGDNNPYQRSNLGRPITAAAADSDDDGDSGHTNEKNAAAATNVFRLAAASMLLSTIPKWKLKRMAKKLG